MHPLNTHVPFCFTSKTDVLLISNAVGENPLQILLYITQSDTYDFEHIPNWTGEWVGPKCIANHFNEV